MAVMCHALFVCCTFFHGSGRRCDYCMFSRSVDTRRCPVMWTVSQYELHDDELAFWHSSTSPRGIVYYEFVMNRSPPCATISCGVLPVRCGDVCLFSVSLGASFQRRCGRPTGVVPYRVKITLISSICNERGYH